MGKPQGIQGVSGEWSCSLGPEVLRGGHLHIEFWYQLWDLGQVLPFPWPQFPPPPRMLNYLVTEDTLGLVF